MSQAESERSQRRCVSCGINVAGLAAATFDCPECDTTISRCETCRKQSKLYECPNCSFRGP